MSGGPVLLSDGTLFAIHGQSDIFPGQDSENRNALAIPIAFYVVVTAEEGGLNNDKKILAAWSPPRKTALDYSLAGYRNQSEGNYNDAISDFSNAIRLEPGWGIHWGDRGIAKAMRGDYEAGIVDITKAINLVISGRQDNSTATGGNSILFFLCYSRAKCWHSLGKMQSALADLTMAATYARSPWDREFLGLK